MPTAMSETISLNFRRPVPLFPLHGLVVLPHAAQALHVFEPRYRQMVEHCLVPTRDDGNILQATPIAMATFAGDEWQSDYEGQPPLRPVVCVTKIIRHVRRPDGRHDLLLHGVCRARIRSIIEPEGPRLFRQAMLEPLERLDRPAPGLPATRRRLRAIFEEGRLARVRSAAGFVELVRRTDIPTSAVIEILSSSLIHDAEARYLILAEPDLRNRARLLAAELARLDGLIARADAQPWREWPKGVSWN